MHQKTKFHNHATFALFFALITLEAGQAFGQKAVIALDGVKIYTLPMVEDSPVSTLSKDDTVYVLGRRGGWIKVACQDGVKGWMQLQVRKKRDSAKKKGRTRLAHNGASFNGSNGSEMKPDRVASPAASEPRFDEGIYRRFGYSFGMGLVQLDYTYNWKFVFHSTPRLALEGSFKHVLGSSADSYFIMANLAYLLKDGSQTLPYVTGGIGIINTVPDRSIDTDSVSNMAINYGLGARRHINEKLSLVIAATQYTTFVGKNIRQFNEITAGLLVGKFWD
jgi:opacity protein-like surface antigen